ncbi:MAG: rhomboid family intramembrane serine protease [Planctomycetes bacterium]|nr:rhomboid family intramembrane serine protease [Planctomycetota bacterium]
MAIRQYNPGYMPPATLALVALNVAIAIADIISGGVIEKLGWARGIDVQYGEYWRLFTCGWVHGSVMHIAFNAYGIYVLGSIVERLHGWKPTVIIYMVSLMGGSALAMAFMDPAIPLVGASGAAYGLFGAVLGFFYVKTGSLKGLVQIPAARMLLIWLAFGAYMSTRPGVSLLGHLGGFVPGVILGMFFEHKYKRELDLYNSLAAALVCVAIAGLTAFACAPFTRSTWYATRALHAYEDGDLERGDELLQEARGRNHTRAGEQNLLTHLTVWRRFHEELPKVYDMDALRLPLTHAAGITSSISPGMPYNFLRDPDAPEPLEPVDTGD